ncbi:MULTISPECIES: TetR/AcrR family transcriptional regulator [unclassified Nocardia]|uniref:TetR/AcrR family transcriptional regulator n=1 Tax=unclassified Nocardia TaxID=2637762 RepID=UPI00278BD1A4|nr:MULTISPECIES: TetR/AcrR family transcriptional regulator [unclassified Nocardia]
MATHPAPTRRRESSRIAILDATRALLGEVPYPKLTIESIAARAGVGKQTIYRWWDSKGAVVLDSLLAVSEHPDGTGIEFPDSGDLAADLKAVLRATTAEFADPAFSAPIRAVMIEVIADPALAATYREKLQQPTQEAILTRLRSAQHAGQLRHDADLPLLIDMLYAPLTHRWLLHSPTLDDAFADAVVDAVLHGFA